MQYTECCITVETERMLQHLPLKKDFQAESPDLGRPSDSVTIEEGGEGPG